LKRDRKKNRFILISLCAISFIGCNSGDKNSKKNVEIKENVPLINYALQHAYPHDTTSFTEGLVVYKGQLYESTGSPAELPQTKSLFGIVNLATGVIDRKAEIDKQKYFGEGIAFFKDKIYQLTYQTKTGFIYDAKTYKKSGEFSFPSREGWGITSDSAHLILSDGTDVLTYLDPFSFKASRTINVKNESGSVVNLNELEYIKGFIYANIYTTNTICKIDPKNGDVVGLLDLSSLASEVKAKYPGSLEMNGIAYDAQKDKVYITGKMWPAIYEIGFSK
jgi:glutamine cyclotransferase